MFLTIFLIAFALSMDAFAVSISGGLICRKVSLFDTLKLSITFGLYQAVMLFLGYSIGGLFKSYIDRFDHYTAFALLLLIGIKMIYEGIKRDPCDVNLSFFKNSNILLLGFATSIDAFIAGLSLSTSKVFIILSVIITGATTFVFCCIGVKLGCRLGCKFGKFADIFGGMILIFLGSKTLFEGLAIF